MEEHGKELRQPIQDDWEDMDLGPLEEEETALPEAGAALGSAVNSERSGEFPQGEFISPPQEIDGGPQQNPAERFCWGEDEQRSARGAGESPARDLAQLARTTEGAPDRARRSGSAGAILAMARSRMEREQASRKQAADMDEFARSYRDVDPATISPEVWAAVRRGESLTAAYIRSENRALRRAQTQLQERLAFLEQQARAGRAGTGSQQSAGVKKRDPIDEYWYSDD